MEISEVSSRLDSITFRGIPLGVFSRTLQNHLYRGKIPSVSFFRFIKLRSYPLSLFVKSISYSLGISKRKALLKEDCVLLGKVNASGRFDHYFRPIGETKDYDLIEFYEGILVFKTENKTTFQDLRILELKEFLQWLKIFQEIKTSLNNYLKFVSENFSISFRNLEPLRSDITLATLLIFRIEEFLRSSKIKLIIVDFDRSFYNAILVLLGNKHKIPTLSFIHGSTHPPTIFKPVLARVLLCWGQIHLDQFNDQAGYTRLMVSGCSWFESPPKKRKRYDESAVENIFLADDYYPHPFINEFAKGTTDLKANAIVKLHPKRKKNFYSKSKKCWPHLQFLEFSRKNNQKFELECDLLIARGSSLIIHAISHGIPVLAFDPIQDGYEFVGQFITQNSQFPVIESSRDLYSILQKICEDKCLLDKIYESNLANLNRYISFFDGEAEQRLLDIVEECLEKN